MSFILYGAISIYNSYKKVELAIGELHQTIHRFALVFSDENKYLAKSARKNIFVRFNSSFNLQNNNYSIRY